MTVLSSEIIVGIGFFTEGYCKLNFFKEKGWPCHLKINNVLLLCLSQRDYLEQFRKFLFLDSVIRKLKQE